MTLVGRNEPCPCGSGKKYKKCCLEGMEAAAFAARREQQLAERERRDRLVQAFAEAMVPSPSTGADTLAWTDDGLDELSNSVVDLVAEKRFEEALAACERLLREWPDVVDGFERSALVHEAMGNAALALDFYRRALEFSERPDQRDGFDEDGRDYWREKIARLAASV